MQNVQQRPGAAGRPAANQPTSPRWQRRPRGRWCSLGWLSVVLIGSLGAPAAVATESVATETATAEIAAEEVKVGPRALSKAFRAAAAKATGSVVTVFAYGQDTERPAARTLDDPGETPEDAPREDSPETLQEDLPEDGIGPTPPPRSDAQGQELPVTGLGSGVILSEDGLIITNHHVVARAQRVVVQLFDQTELEAFQVHGDPHSDIATLRVKSPEPLAAATLGDSDALEIGDWVLAIGSPFKLEATVSAGIISAKNRSIQRIRRGRLLQTDAAINPGNSGGALIDLNGDVVGINTAIATRTGAYQGIGFVIPMNQARWIAEELANHGRVRRAAMGIRLADLTKPLAMRLNLPMNLPMNLGVLVHQVIDNSAAAQAGIEPLDVIVAFAGEPVRRPADLQEIVERQPIGSKQQVRVFRQDREIELEVVLAPREDPTALPTAVP